MFCRFALISEKCNFLDLKCLVSGLILLQFPTAIKPRTSPVDIKQGIVYSGEYTGEQIIQKA